MTTHVLTDDDVLEDPGALMLLEEYGADLDAMGWGCMSVVDRYNMALTMDSDYDDD